MKKIKILIVEDAKLISDRLISSLSELDGQIEISVATCMEEARNFFDSIPPHIVILDLMLPDGNGINLLEKIKMERMNTLVIILTNFPFTQVKKKCRQLGADYFYSKENEFEKVKETIKSLVNHKDKVPEFGMS